MAELARVAGRQRAARSAGMLLGARLLLVAAATVLAWLLVIATAGYTPFPPSPMIAALSLLPVNVVCLLLTARLLRAQRRTLRDLFGYQPGTWARELGFGLLWIVVLSVPFAAAIIGTMWLLHGSALFTAFETVFYNPETTALGSPGLSLTLGIVAVLTFAPLNAPAEEAVFRGYAQGQLAEAWSATGAIAVCSVAFGVQHAFFAPTTDAMLVYVVAFTVWGVGSGLIVRYQRRLVPITIAHFVVNLMTSLPAAIFPILALTGVLAN